MSDRIRRLRRANMIWVFIWLAFSALIVVVLIVSLNSEQRKDSGTRVQDIHTESVTCESDSVAYPFFSFDGSNGKNLKIIAMSEQGKVRSISLQYILYYNDAELISQSESENHATMNLQFGKNELGADAMDATYAKLNNALKFGLYQTYDKMSDASKKFLLLEGTGDLNLDTLIKAYNDIGMECKIVNN